MDYITKSTNRRALRAFSKIFRRLFGVKDESAPFPVLEALERLPDIFQGCSVSIVSDDALPPHTPARCFPDGTAFTIEVKETVYRGAYEKQIGAYLGFICHEICHIFLFYIGFTPIVARSFGNDEIVPYQSVEWQAKALCGEVMMPYQATAHMSVKELMCKYHVSKASAQYRQKY